ncbi:decaprenyl-phosphate phosphoribosyltransferase [Microbacterium lacticum]
MKNLLVFAAPLAAGVIFDPRMLGLGLIAFAAFCLSASAVYLVNDSRDVAADRAHPTKRNRPIAAGIVPVPVAVVVALVLFAAGIAVALLASWQLAVVIAVYDLIQLAYCFWLKHVSLVDIAVVASGFLLRMIAGGAATGVELSQWFLLVAVFGSLLMVSGKRYAEILVSKHADAPVRGSLKNYTPSYLRFVWQSAAAILMLSYTQWAFSGAALGDPLWISLSVVPFILAIFRYCQHIDRGDAEAPEDIALHDRSLQVMAGAWVVLLVVAVYAPAVSP